MIRLLLILSIGFFAFNSSNAQENWQVYLAQYDDGVGSTIVDLGQVNNAPNKDFPFILVTGVVYEDCDSTGFPNKPEFENLYAISDGVVDLVNKMDRNLMVGTFTYICERLDYIYLTDTTNIRLELTKLYQDQFPTYEFYINLELDKDWEYYLDFLFPNEETQESMSNMDVLLNLEEAGDDLTEPRQVDHWVYFKDKENRKLFADYILKQGFKIHDERKIKGYEYGLSIQFSRVDYVDLESINEVTLALNKKAKELDGEYDGWETFVVTK